MEIQLLNTHYFLQPEEKLDFYTKPHYTIQPAFLENVLKKENVIFITPQNKLLHLLEYPTPLQYITAVPTYNYLLTDDSKMFNSLKYEDLSIFDWLKRYWNATFVVTHPFYKVSDTNHYIFSSKYAKAIPLHTEDNFYEVALEHGCYSVGNGLILALSMVALGKWKEKEFLQSMELLLDVIKPIDDTLPFYTNLFGEWSQFVEPFPYHLIDHIFAYAFQFNSKNIYQYIYKKSISEEPIVCHMTNNLPNVFLSTIFSNIKRKDQFQFISDNKHLVKQYHHILSFFDTSSIEINFPQRIYQIVTNKSLYRLFLQPNNTVLKQLKYYININKHSGMQSILRTIIAFDKKYSSRRLLSIYEKFMELLPKEFLQSLSYLLIENMIFKKCNKPYIFPSKKLIRRTIFKNQTFTYFSPYYITAYLKDEALNIFPLPYKLVKDMGTRKKVLIYTSWKQILQVVDNEFQRMYSSIITKRIVKKLIWIKKITSEHPEASHVLQFLQHDYYRDHKEELWK